VRLLACTQQRLRHGLQNPDAQHNQEQAALPQAK
jgi:hypothetical protein